MADFEWRMEEIMASRFGSLANTLRRPEVRDPSCMDPAEEIPIVPPSARIVYKSAVAFG